mgnify:CR=1 FL=1
MLIKKRKFYTIETITDSEVGSVFPQIVFKNLNEAFSIDADYEITEGIELEGDLQPQAKLTDVISQASISAQGLLINNNAMEVLEKFQLPPHSYVPCTIYDQEGGAYGYSYLVLRNSDHSRLIDFEHTVFHYYQFGFQKDHIGISSFKAFEEAKKSLPSKDWWISATDLRLKSNPFDLIFLSGYLGEIIVSEGLKDELRKNRITGIDIQDAPVELC